MRIVPGTVLWALASVLAAPIAAVWQAWTTREGIVSFMAPEAEIDARVGGAIHIHFNRYGEPGMKGADDMRVMALQPPTMLSVDWNAPPHLRRRAPEGAGTRRPAARAHPYRLARWL